MGALLESWWPCWCFAGPVGVPGAPVGVLGTLLLSLALCWGAGDSVRVLESLLLSWKLCCCPGVFAGVLGVPVGVLGSLLGFRGLLLGFRDLRWVPGGTVGVPGALLLSWGLR